MFFSFARSSVIILLTLLVGSSHGGGAMVPDDPPPLVEKGEPSSPKLASVSQALDPVLAPARDTGRELQQYFFTPAPTGSSLVGPDFPDFEEVLAMADPNNPYLAVPIKSLTRITVVGEDGWIRNSQQVSSYGAANLYCIRLREQLQERPPYITRLASVTKDSYMVMPQSAQIELMKDMCEDITGGRYSCWMGLRYNSMILRFQWENGQFLTPADSPLPGEATSLSSWANGGGTPVVGSPDFGGPCVALVKETSYDWLSCDCPSPELNDLDVRGVLCDNPLWNHGRQTQFNVNIVPHGVSGLVEFSLSGWLPEFRNRTQFELFAVPGNYVTVWLDGVTELHNSSSLGNQNVQEGSTLVFVDVLAEVDLTINLHTGGSVIISTGLSRVTVNDLKVMIEASTGIEVIEQRLLFQGQTLQNDEFLLSSYLVTFSLTIDLMPAVTALDTGVCNGILPLTPANTFIPSKNEIVGGKTSTNGLCNAVMQGDGNFVLTRTGSVEYQLFSSDTAGIQGAKAFLRRDGNFVVEDSTGTEHFSTNTAGHEWSVMHIQDDCNLVIVGESNCDILWSLVPVGYDTGACPPAASAASDITPNADGSTYEIQTDRPFYSSNGLYSLTFQQDSNIILNQRDAGGSGWSSIWNSGTGVGFQEQQFFMQADGNLVAEAFGVVFWSTGTGGNPGAFLRIEDDGAINILDVGTCDILWSSVSLEIDVSGSSVFIPMQLNNLVSDLKEVIAAVTNIPPSNQDLSFQGQQLIDGNTLESHNMQLTSVVNLALVTTLDTNACSGILSLTAENTFVPGEIVETKFSTNTMCSAGIQNDGSFVVYRHGDVVYPVFSTDTGAGLGDKAFLRSDGNFVVENSQQQLLFGSGTSGYYGSVIHIQDDCNLMIVEPFTCDIVWSTEPVGYTDLCPTPSAASIIAPNADGTTFEIPIGSIYSPNGIYRLDFESNGDLVLNQRNGVDNWSLIWNSTNSATSIETQAQFFMQADGNLVVRKAANGNLVWSTETGGNPGAFLRVEDNGALYIIDAGTCKILWSTFKLTINLPDGNMIFIGMVLDNLVSDLKEAIATVINIPPSNQDLLFGGQRLVDSSTLESYNMELTSVVDVVLVTALEACNDIFSLTPANTFVASENEIIGGKMSSNSLCNAVMESDGNFVVYRTGDVVYPVFTTNTTGNQENTRMAYLRSDGNFVVIDVDSGEELFSTGTSNHERSVLHIQDDCNLVVVEPYDCRVVWSWAPVGYTDACLPASAASDIAPVGRDRNLTGEVIVSTNGMYKTNFQNNGNIFTEHRNADGSWDITWSSGSGVILNENRTARLLNSGDLAVTELVRINDPEEMFGRFRGRVVWYTETGGHDGAFLRLLDDGSLNMVDPSTCEVLWENEGLSINHPDGYVFSIDTIDHELNRPVIDLKKLIEVMFQIPTTLQILHFNNQQLVDSEPLNSYGIVATSILDLSYNTVLNAGVCDGILSLTEGNTFLPEEHIGFIVSTNTECRAQMQVDGNFVLYRLVGGVAFPIFATGTQGGQGDMAQLRLDGNFVVVNSNGQELFETGTSGYWGSVMHIQDDCNLLIVEASSCSVVWSLAPVGYEGICGHESVTADITPNADGSTYQVDRAIWSANGLYRTLFLTTGLIQTYQRSSSGPWPVVWASPTFGGSGRQFFMQEDGNFVILESNGDLVWSTETDQHPGAFMRLSDAGTLHILDIPTCEVIWSSVSGDVCEDAHAVTLSTTNDFVVVGNTEDATIDINLPACGTFITTPGVWYTFTTPVFQSGMRFQVTLDTCDNSFFDTIITLFQGSSCDDLNCIAANDDHANIPGCSSMRSHITSEVSSNTQYFVLVHGFGGAVGPFSLRFVYSEFGEQACIDATELTIGSSELVVNGDTSTSPFSSAPVCGNIVQQNAQGLWYKFTSGPIMEKYTFSTCGSAQFDTRIFIYQGGCAALSCVAANDDFSGCSSFTSHVEVVLDASTEYYILIGGFSVAVGSFELTIEKESPSNLPVFNYFHNSVRDTRDGGFYNDPGGVSGWLIDGNYGSLSAGNIAAWPLVNSAILSTHSIRFDFLYPVTINDVRIDTYVFVPYGLYPPASVRLEVEQDDTPGVIAVHDFPVFSSGDGSKNSFLHGLHEGPVSSVVVVVVCPEFSTTSSGDNRKCGLSEVSFEGFST